MAKAPKVATVDVDVNGLVAQELRVRLTGRTPLLMHNVNLVDPQYVHTKEVARLIALKKKKGADTELYDAQIGDAECEGGMYYSDAPWHDGFNQIPAGPYIPGEWISAGLRDAARLSRKGKTVQGGLAGVPCSPLLYWEDFDGKKPGPRNMAALKADERYRLRRVVGVNGSKVVRVRPRFPTPWAVEVTLTHTPYLLSRSDLLEYLTHAGTFTGIGDGRNIGFGRFQVDVIG
jgi:hypothetical protein